MWKHHGSRQSFSVPIGWFIWWISRPGMINVIGILLRTAEKTSFWAGEIRFWSMRHTENKQVDTKVAKVLRRTFRGFSSKACKIKKNMFHQWCCEVPKTTWPIAQRNLKVAANPQDLYWNLAPKHPQTCYQDFMKKFPEFFFLACFFKNDSPKPRRYTKCAWYMNSFQTCPCTSKLCLYRGTSVAPEETFKSGKREKEERTAKGKREKEDHLQEGGSWPEFSGSVSTKFQKHQKQRHQNDHKHMATVPAFSSGFAKTSRRLSVSSVLPSCNILNLARFQRLDFPPSESGSTSELIQR